MNTPAHLVLGAAFCASGDRKRYIGAAVLGGLLPDLSLYLLAGVSLTLLDIPPNVVFDELYFSDTWQLIFAIDNSFVLWGLALAVAVWRKWRFLMVVALAALLHLLCDFPLHHDDGRAHFWPLTSWVFESPFSYWDRNQGAGWIAPIEALLVTMGAVMIWRRRPGLVWSVLIAVLLLAEYWIVREWLFVFAMNAPSA